MKTIFFNRNTDNEFWTILNGRVQNYFNQNNISIHASKKMYFKLFFFILCYILPYLLIVFTDWSLLIKWCMCAIMGFAMAGIGFNISHQAAHGAISSSSLVNRILSLSFNLVGMSDYIWKIKHNVFHHAYTNIYLADEALKEGDIIRLSSEAKWKPIHKYQHIYTVFVYAIFTIFWAFILDFEKLFRYNGNGSLVEHPHPLKEILIFWITKIFYIMMMFVVPYYYIKFSLLEICIGFFTLHVIASSLITHVLQVEHLNDEAVFVEVDKNGKVNKSWAVNQLEGTANFKTSSALFEWFIGGCNYQIEHHLFPYICSEHYPKISFIVEATAAEFGFKYQSFLSFSSALHSHYNFLKKLSKNN